MATAKHFPDVQGLVDYLKKRIKENKKVAQGPATKIAEPPAEAIQAAPVKAPAADPLNSTPLF
jgi:hypothetical protein